MPRCVVLGDFNVDLEKDKVKSETLLTWAESESLALCLPEGPTSLRSNRTIDYALVAGVRVTLQAHQGDTTSDHKPLIGVIWCADDGLKMGRKPMGEETLQ